jgi:hypothetical protein
MVTAPGCFVHPPPANALGKHGVRDLRGGDARRSVQGARFGV